jgi:hypothetical protein
MRAVAAANSSSTRACIIATAPAPIIAAARPTCPAFSDISARASANSLPTSLASCAMASPKSIERSVGEGIAITLICCAMRCGRRATELRAVFCGTLQKSRDAEPGELGDPHERRGLPSGGVGKGGHTIARCVRVGLPYRACRACRIPTDAPNWSERSWPRRPSSSERSDATLEAL